MGRIGLTVFFLSFALSAGAEPRRSLGQVESIAPWLKDRSGEIALFTERLARSLGEADVFFVVNPQEEHDAWLVVRTCNRHGKYLPPSSHEGRVCDVSLSDVHAIHQPPIWYMSPNRIREIFAFAANQQEAIAILTEDIKAAVREQKNAIPADAEPRPAADPR